jgi:hypothetical protein
MTNTFPPGGRSLSCFDGKRASVVLRLPDGEREFVGAAEYRQDPLLGRVLCVRVEADGFPGEPTELLISEEEWGGVTSPVRGQEYDYRFEAP